MNDLLDTELPDPVSSGIGCFSSNCLVVRAATNNGVEALGVWLAGALRLWEVRGRTLGCAPDGGKGKSVTVLKNHSACLNATTESGGSVIVSEWLRFIHGTGSACAPPKLPTLLPP